MQNMISISRPNAGKVRGRVEVYPDWAQRRANTEYGKGLPLTKGMIIMQSFFRIACCADKFTWFLDT